jgi:hypothetical protein
MFRKHDDGKYYYYPIAKTKPICLVKSTGFFSIKKVPKELIGKRIKIILEVVN